MDVKEGYASNNNESEYIPAPEYIPPTSPPPPASRKTDKVHSLGRHIS